MNKKECCVKVLVLTQIDFKDHDVIINTLTKEGVYLSFYARGARKVLSKNASAIQPFMISDITYFESDKPLKLLKSAKVDESLYDYNSYDAMLAAHIVLGVINDQASMMIEPGLMYYKVTTDALLALKTEDVRMTLSLFLTKVLKLQGVSLVYDYCASCGSQHINYISVHQGGFVCHECLESNDVNHYDLDFLKLFRIINYCAFDDLPILTTYHRYSEDILGLMYDFYISYSGFKIKNIKEFISV